MGVVMLPGWAWLTAFTVAALGIILWRRSGLGPDRKWLTLAALSGTSATAFFFLAALSAEYSCSRPPPDGLCIFAGFPYLTVCTVLAATAFVAAVQAVRLRRAR